ncbi:MULTISPECIES: vWA domain-containing protein [Flavobacterium]|uniref:VWA domain-containing protein n=1 Tax=Flavobacterium hankyongi TaxID=1176532 RepID=A0ABP9A9P0_9FLAO|nr:von Willebrand factor type A domain-containing protein [Flavobacterium sp. N1846]
MKSVKLFSLAITMLISFVAMTQERTITGIVSDASGPLPGVNVIVKGTTRGVQTGFDGKYAIKASQGEKLVFSFMGMKDQIRVIGTSNIINVVMQDDSKNLQEVVVVGYGTSEERQDYYSAPRRTKKSKADKNVAPMISGVAITYERDSKIVIKGKRSDEKRPISNSNEDYGVFVENEFESPKQSPLSTFSIDVDNASYTNIRRFINNGQQVPKDAVRVEEMMNFFKYQYPQPKGEHPFSITTNYSDCPWNPKNKLVRIGLQGKNIPTENLPNSNFVFLIDVSGSMSDENKLPLLKQSMKILVNELRPEDKVSIVVYAGAAGLVLPPTAGNKKETIINALDQLQAGGSTAGGEGINLAYKIAMENFIKNGNNRVILATDGDFNVGASSDNDMERLIEEKRKSGVFLTCLGYGMGNYKDSKMETLANKGNGNYAYIDNIQEANRFLSKEFKGSMFAIAKDVKIQIEFNPKHVQSYRLIGYENRKLRAEDFTNDAIDAGELGSGHTVTALYEIIPTGVKSDFFKEPTDLKYSQPKSSENSYNDELATIKFRYKKPDGDKSIEMVEVIDNKPQTFEAASGDFKFTTAVAWLGLKLRDSKLIENKSSDDIKNLAKQGLQNDSDGYRAEFIRLIENVRL